MKKNKWLLGIVSLILLVNIPVHAATCRELFTPELIEEVRSVFDFVKYAVPILFTLLTAFDFAKAVFVQDKDGLNKAKSNFVKRAVAALIIFFAPYIISLIMKLVNDIITNGDSCVKEFLRA